jgi:two-component system chemotaxis response regulator CheB
MGHTIEAIAIGASLGGPIAVEKILSLLPAALPVPIFLVQHISDGFTKGFADWLQRSSHLIVKLAENGEIPKAGTVYIPPDGYHMKITDSRTIALHFKGKTPGEYGIGQLFGSMAMAYGAHAIGVLLTGMGRDGAEGLLEMRHRGAATIAEDESSCVIFGMPKEAIKIGAAQFILHIDKIPEQILRLISTGSYTR